MQQHAAILAEAIQAPGGSPPQTVRGEVGVGTQIDHMSVGFEIEFSDQMAWMRVIAMPTVTIDRHIGVSIIG
jgi:putative Mn2+ efflux pump MntP